MISRLSVDAPYLQSQPCILTALCVTYLANREKVMSSPLWRCYDRPCSSLMASEFEKIQSRQHESKMHQLLVAAVEKPGWNASAALIAIVEKDMTGKLLILVTLRRELF
jgi:hypothetical protein